MPLILLMLLINNNSREHLLAASYRCCQCYTKSVASRLYAVQLRSIMQGYSIPTLSTYGSKKVPPADKARELTSTKRVVYFAISKAKHAIQQRNKVHKGRKPEGQMPIMLATYSTRRINVNSASTL